MNAMFVHQRLIEAKDQLFLLNQRVKEFQKIDLFVGEIPYTVSSCGREWLVFPGKSAQKTYIPVRDREKIHRKIELSHDYQSLLNDRTDLTRWICDAERQLMRLSMADFRRASS